MPFSHAFYRLADCFSCVSFYHRCGLFGHIAHGLFFIFFGHAFGRFLFTLDAILCGMRES
jgi:hypothetical protein